MPYVFGNVLDALRSLRWQSETMVMPKQGGNYTHLYWDSKQDILNVLGHRNALQCFEFPMDYNLQPRIAFELSCLDVAEQLGYKPNADVLHPVLMDLLLTADFPRFRQLKEQDLKLDVPKSNCVQYLLTAANTYLKG